MRKELNLQIVSFMGKVEEINFLASNFGKTKHPAVFNLNMLKEKFNSAGECPNMDGINNHLFGLQNSINDTDKPILDGTPEGILLFEKMRGMETQAKIIFHQLQLR